MYNRLKTYLEEQQLFVPSHRLILGVSGGIDSVVLAHLLKRLGAHFVIAHCNFNLRGNDSMDDEAFVRQLADNMGDECFVHSFATTEYAAEKGISIEMAARELRYRWFEELRTQLDFDWIVVGHHLDDAIETFLLNISRGTGIRGLSGIQPKAGKVIRPLLFASRSDVEAYAEQHQLTCRYDQSNHDTRFKRNLIRHELLPLFETLNPSFRSKVSQTIGYLNDAEKVYLEKIEEARRKCVQERVNWIEIDLEALTVFQPLSTYLFEFLRPFLFNGTVIGEIEQALKGEPGRNFYSATHRLVVDRKRLIITRRQGEEQSLFYIEESDRLIENPERLSITVEDYDTSYRIPPDRNVAVLDYDRLSFPLLIRKWQQGEYFRPLGMEGYKKLSDFFIDEKYSIPEKEAAWLLVSDNKVAWIIGKRIDDRFKITPQTRRVLRIERIFSEDVKERTI
ncbi:tRNA lysidine(34) synthetase TilS [Roseimarinus sediminis]|uniref:tRNA lysidine(34) synthetase TilS n=1 Tax=Roseimarinus sediminis TaxID=1610899 RepID=UPI003D2146FC